MQFKKGCNNVVIELRVVQFRSEIILMISNQSRAARFFDYKIKRMTSDLIIHMQIFQDAHRPH